MLRWLSSLFKGSLGRKKHEEHGHKMKPLPHLYEVSLSGGPTGHATLLAAGVPPLHSAPPKEFDGPGDAWSPEQFLLAAVGTCFMFTFRAVALASKFDYSSLDLSGSGTLRRPHFKELRAGSFRTWAGASATAWRLLPATFTATERR